MLRCGIGWVCNCAGEEFASVTTNGLCIPYSCFTMDDFHKRRLSCKYVRRVVFMWTSLADHGHRCVGEGSVVESRMDSCVCFLS